MAGLKIMLAGQGSQLYFLARAFQAKGHLVTIVCKDAGECAWLSRRLKALVVCGDASLPRLLGEAGAAEMDVVLAATPRDADNLLICQSAAHQFGVKRTLALVNDPELEPVMRELGVDGGFSMTQVLSGLIERRVESAAVLNLIPLGQGEVNLTEVQLDTASPAVGRTLVELGLPEDSLIACVFRNGRPLVPRGGTELLAGDKLVVMTLPGNYARVLRLLTGERR
jgi:trk system potassium uptake protein TrkA